MDGTVELPSLALDAAREISLIAARAWSKDLLPGFSGNVSRLLPGSFGGQPAMLITRSGTSKSGLSQHDFAVIGLAAGEMLAGGQPSTETPLHVEVYRNCAEAKAIIHSHPPCLLALSLVLPPEQRLTLPLFEARTYRSLLGHAGEHEPGSAVLAKAVAEKARTCKAVWMEGHGLVVHGPYLSYCLAVTEELELIARIQLMTMGAVSA